MSFQRRHYQAIADVISARHSYISEAIDNPESTPNERRYDTGYCDGIESVAKRLADMFGRDNPQFDRTRFLAACGVKKSEGASAG